MGIKIENHGNGQISFKCPGCGLRHLLWVKRDPSDPLKANGPTWGYNGDPEKPTLTPSILSRSGHYGTHFKAGDGCWCDFESRSGRASPFKCSICHSYVTDGKIQFLSDCTHALADKTVEMPDINP